MYESSSLIFKVVILLLKYNCSTMVVGFPNSSVGKEPTCNAGDPGSIPGSGKSTGEGKGYPFPYFDLENSMDYIYIVHAVAKSWTQLSDFHFHIFLVFPDSSVGKESACNAGDPGLIPGSRRSPGEGIGNPLQYSWASLVAQLVKNAPAMRETCVRSLEKGKATHSSILAWRIPVSCPSQ